MRVLKILLGYCFALLAISSLMLVNGLAWIHPARVFAQQPTGSVPTVTGTPPGPMLTVHWPGQEEQIYVRAGPGRDYDAVGVLVVGQPVPALGQISTGEWIKIAYPGAPDGTAWVLAALVDLVGEAPPNIPVPPTPTPRTTPTTDPTLAARYQVEIPATRLPTYTPPDPLNIPTFPAETSGQGRGGVPMGLVIIGLGVVGLFGTLISLLRGR